MSTTPRQAVSIGVGLALELSGLAVGCLWPVAGTLFMKLADPVFACLADYEDPTKPSKTS